MKLLVEKSVFQSVTELIKLRPEAHLGGTLPSKWKVYLNRSFALKMPHKGLKWHQMPCLRILIPCPVLILDAPLTTMQQSGLWTFNWKKNDLKHTITSKVMLVLFTHVFARDQYVFMICGHFLDSVIRGSSELYELKVYLSFGLFEIVTQTNYIPTLTMKDFSPNYYEIWNANPFYRLHKILRYYQLG